MIEFNEQAGLWFRGRVSPWMQPGRQTWSERRPMRAERISYGPSRRHWAACPWADYAFGIDDGRPDLRGKPEAGWAASGSHDERRTM